VVRTEAVVRSGLRRTTGAWIVAILCVVCSATLQAQANDTIDRLLDAKQALFGDAAAVILSAAGLVPEDATPSDAAAAVATLKLLGKTPLPDQPVTLGQVCLLVMRTQGVSGGLFYRLFPSPRYAARELAAQGLLKGNTHPSRVISGEEVMWILSAVLSWRGKD
jgi:hypothetical protein